MMTAWISGSRRGDRRISVNELEADRRRMPTSGRTLLLMSWPRRPSRCRPCDLRLLGVVTATEPLSVVATLPKPDVVVIDNPCGDDLAEHDAWQVALVPFRTGGVPVLALLDDPQREKREQAIAAGADAVLAADAPMEEVAAAIRGLDQAAERVAAGAALPEAVDRLTFGLAAMMRSVAWGATVEPEGAARLSGLLPRTVRETGSARLLDAIASIHEPTYRHCILMAGLMASFVVRHALREDEAALLTRGCVVHDVGKALVPTRILDKTTRLGAAERAVIQGHPSLGFDLLRSQGLFEAATLQIVRSHHEYLDGTGYPDRLSGPDIPDHVRLSTICDVFTALVEPRVYRSPLPPAKALAVMDDMGGKLDSAFLDAFKAVVPLDACLGG